jgi:hypothetical protein
MLRVTLCLLLAASSASADIFSVLKFVPAKANTVAVVNVQALLASPRAVKEGWSKLEHTEYLAGAVPLNPLVTRMTLAKEMDPVHPASGGSIALLETVKPVVLEKIAPMVSGTAATLADDPALVNPRGTYFLKAGDQLLAAILPESKQDASRFARSLKTAKEIQFNTALSAALARHEQAHIAIAVDLSDLFEDAHAVAAVAHTQSIRTDPEQVKLVEKFVVGLKLGVFTASITADGITAVLRMESKSLDPKLNPEFVKAFLIETMNHNGTGLEDLRAAKTATSGNVVSLSFMISDPELARVMTIVLPPAALPADAESIALAPAGPNANATVKYFTAVNAIVDDIRKKKVNEEDYAKTAQWHDAAATKIDALTVLGVDKAVVDYGAGVASRLRMIAESLEGVPVKVEELQGQAWAVGGSPRYYPTRRGVRFNPWWSPGLTNLGEVRKKQAEVVKQDQSNREKLWSQIDGKRSETRGKIAATWNVVVPEKK